MQLRSLSNIKTLEERKLDYVTKEAAKKDISSMLKQKELEMKSLMYRLNRIVPTGEPHQLLYDDAVKVVEVLPQCDFLLKLAVKDRQAPLTIQLKPEHRGNFELISFVSREFPEPNENNYQ